MFWSIFFSGQIDNVLFDLLLASHLTSYFPPLLYTVNITYYSIIINFGVRQISNFKEYLNYAGCV